MLPYLLRRLVSMLLVLFAIVTATFILMHSIPGGPFTTEKNLPEAIQKTWKNGITSTIRYGSNTPII